MKSTKPTSFDIAKRAGVSQPTVSRALSNSTLVSKETRDKIHAIAKELDYKTEVRKSPIKTPKNLALVFGENPTVTKTPLSPFFLSVIANVIQAASVQGYNILISMQHFEKDWKENDISQSDGIIFLGLGNYASYIAKAARLDYLDKHFIGWGPIVPNQPGLFVGCDNSTGGYLATQHLIELHHNTIAFFGNSDDKDPETSARHSGYIKALLEAKLVVDPSLQFNVKADGKDSDSAVEALCQQHPTVTAIVCASDEIALCAISALDNIGKKVPDDLAIVGFDDIPAASMSTPPLTTVRQNTKLIAETLVNNLIELIEGGTVYSTQLPVELVERKSSVPAHN